MWFINFLIPLLFWDNKTFLLQHLVSRRKHAGSITSRDFMQENQALNQRLVEMRKSNEEILQMMENLKSFETTTTAESGFLDKELQVIPVLAGVAATLPKCSVM